MSIRKRTYKLEDWSLWEGLFLSLFTFGLFIGFDIPDKGFITNVWTNIFCSSITISIKTISGIDPLMLTSLLVTMIIVFKNRKSLMNLDNKYS